MRDMKAFFNEIRSEPFGGRLTKFQVSGCEIIIQTYDKNGQNTDDRELAYILATAFHETAKTMRPVRETLSKSDDLAITKLDRAYLMGKLPQVKQPYWRKDAEGKSWLGRGYVQLTHRCNYQIMSLITGYPLLREPALAMRSDIAAVIIIDGMLQGHFTGKRLENYIHGRRCDFIGARQIVNGTDKAESIANIALMFYAALTKSWIE